MSNIPSEQTFLKDVSEHTMTVLLDNGVYRHLSFSNNGSFNQKFDIVTYPGFLVYSGDMGCFVFSRLKDMFEFFRVRPRDESPESLFINLGYWAEKLEAVDRCGSRTCGAEEFSSEKFESTVKEHVAEWINDYSGEYDSSEEEVSAQRKTFADQLNESIKEDILCRADDGEHACYEALRDFSFEFDGHKYEFYDTWEWDLTEYTFCFIWC